MNVLTHLTINTGHIALQRREGVDPDTLLHLRALVRAGSGWVEPLGLRVDLIAPQRDQHGRLVDRNRMPDARMFRLWKFTPEGPAPAKEVLFGGVCWGEDDGLWEALWAIHRSPEMEERLWMSEELQEIAIKGDDYTIVTKFGLDKALEQGPSLPKPDRPWCAVVLRGGLHLLDHETVEMLGDFERCLAWAIIEEATRPTVLETGGGKTVRFSNVRSEGSRNN